MNSYPDSGMIPHNQLRCQKKVLHIIFKNTNFLEIESKGLNIGALLKNPLDFHSPQGCKSLGEHPKKLKFKYILDSGRLVMFGLQNFSVQQFHGHLKIHKRTFQRFGIWDAYEVIFCLFVFCLKSTKFM